MAKGAKCAAVDLGSDRLSDQRETGLSCSVWEHFRTCSQFTQWGEEGGWFHFAHIGGWSCSSWSSIRRFSRNIWIPPLHSCAENPSQIPIICTHVCRKPGPNTAKQIQSGLRFDVSFKKISGSCLLPRPSLITWCQQLWRSPVWRLDWCRVLPQSTHVS